MTDRPKLLGISGSLRAGSFSTAIVEGLRVALEPHADLTLFRLNDVPLYNGDLDTAWWRCARRSRRRTGSYWFHRNIITAFPVW